MHKAPARPRGHLAGVDGARTRTRAAGGWHAEWETLTEALRLAGGAARHGEEMLAGLRVDATRMRRNLGLEGGLIMAESVTVRLSPHSAMAPRRSS